mmetsp:Transcript_59559/g.194307  ORF Transcript_59559/g.194307 Transcript_59559/m.194307 type:complete len:140 (+) Transcript_59559:2113-2532(+)
MSGSSMGPSVNGPQMSGLAFAGSAVTGATMPNLSFGAPLTSPMWCCASAGSAVLQSGALLTTEHPTAGMGMGFPVTSPSISAKSGESLTSNVRMLPNPWHHVPVQLLEEEGSPHSTETELVPAYLVRRWFEVGDAIRSV